MSPAPALSEPEREGPDGVERRSRRRYPILLDVHYKLKRGRTARLGTGITLNVSSRGVLFVADESLPTGSPVELTMNWPFLLEGLCPLKLVMHGRVVRSDLRGIAVRTRDHEFRVSGVRSSPAQEGDERRSA